MGELLSFKYGENISNILSMAKLNGIVDAVVLCSILAGIENSSIMQKKE